MKTSLVALSLLLISCGTNLTAKYKEDENIKPRDYIAEARKGKKLSKSALLASVRLHQDYLPSRNTARKYSKELDAQYITIHSTQNWGRTAHAPNHSLALKNYKVGGLSWHFSVDQYRAIQHLKLDETAKHTGNNIGNKHSIGIEMCENTGSHLHATIERTARLVAWLMIENDISLQNVVPHYHWNRARGHKTCPHFLLEADGTPGAKWNAFTRKVNYYYKNAK